jgi:asparagine N-glycosylation enzyme membrane subunit Stt3
MRKQHSVGQKIFAAILSAAILFCLANWAFGLRFFGDADKKVLVVVGVVGLVFLGLVKPGWLSGERATKSPSE